MQVFYFLIYNLIFMPLFFVFSHIAALFHAKLRKGVLGRYRIFRDIQNFRIGQNHAKIAVVHCASMGEFEHIRPFLKKLKEARPDLKIIVLFFSPSGFDNVKQFEATDLFTYAPFDWAWPVWRFMATVKPAIWIIAKHDVWPNQVWLCKLLKIPVYLINASLHSGSSRIHGFTRHFHKNIYKYFTNILTISAEDRENFTKLADPAKIIVAGDTKYDQVLYRREESKLREVIPKEIWAGKWAFVAGSTWPEDEIHLLPAITKLLQKYPDFLAIICPHEPTPAHLEQLAGKLSGVGFVTLSNIQKYAGERIILIDRIGVLANLYSLASAAYVGGSFRQNIHNVLEAAVYHIPVLFGPVNSNSHEAQLLKSADGASEVLNESQITETLNKFLADEAPRRKMGNNAGNVVEKNCGATERTINTILNTVEKK